MRDSASGFLRPSTMPVMPEGQEPAECMAGKKTSNRVCLFTYYIGMDFHPLTLAKNVSGTYGDPAQGFPFGVKLTAASRRPLSTSAPAKCPPVSR